jgi:hypothetical protein
MLTPTGVALNQRQWKYEYAERSSRAADDCFFGVCVKGFAVQPPE